MDNLANATDNSGILIARYDVGERTVRVDGTGCWTMPLLERHLDEFRRLLSKARSGGGVRVLSNLSRAMVQGPEIAQRIERFTAETFGPEDRIAVVVASSLLKLQMRRVVMRARFATFMSQAAAEEWLRHQEEPDIAVPGFVQRAPRRLTSIVTMLENDEGQTVPVRIVNISTSGYLFNGNAEMPVGSKVCVNLPKIGKSSGTIVRVRGSLAGVRFDRSLVALDLPLSEITQNVDHAVS